MERVRQAITKAREEGRSAQVAGFPPASSGGGVPLGEGEGAVSDIEYTHTSRQRLDERILRKNRVIAGSLYDERAEVYRQLRSQILPQMKANGWRTLAITSPNENAGKTLTAVNLAISISQEVNQTVLLVDLDLRQPSIHATLGLDVEKGVADCVQDGEPVENALINPEFQRLVVLPGKPLGPYSSELLTSPNMMAFMNEIVSRYESRIIIFDLPPLLRNDDALVFTPQVDATLLVLEDGGTTANQIKRSLHLLDNSNLIGTLLNKARV